MTKPTNETCATCGHGRISHYDYSLQEIMKRDLDTKCMYAHCPCKKFISQRDLIAEADERYYKKPQSPFDCTDLKQDRGLDEIRRKERQRLKAEVEKVLDDVLRDEIINNETIRKQHKIKDINSSIELSNLVVELKKRLFG